MIPAETQAAIRTMRRDQGLAPTEIARLTGVRRELVYYYLRDPAPKAKKKAGRIQPTPRPRSVGLGPAGPHRSEIPDSVGAGYDLDSIELSVRLPWCSECSGVGCMICGNTGVGA